MKEIGRFLWCGQPSSEWPVWLISRNYAAGNGRIIIHTLAAKLTAELGDSIVINSQYDVTIEKAV